MHQGYKKDLEISERSMKQRDVPEKSNWETNKT